MDDKERELWQKILSAHSQEIKARKNTTIALENYARFKELQLVTEEESISKDDGLTGGD